MLRSAGYCRTPEQTARFFLHTSGLKKEMIGKCLGNMYDERGLESLRLFAEGIGMEGLPFVRSLRKFLAKFKMPGEAQMVDRILGAFAAAFSKQNPDEFSGPTAVHGLAFSVIMLNTDVHSRSLKSSKKMTRVQFIKNCGGIDYEKEFTAERLGKIYDEISKSEIAHQTDKHDDGNLFSEAVKEGYMKKQGATAPYVFRARERSEREEGA